MKNNEEQEITDLFNALSIQPKQEKLKTEDTGKIFEMAICLAYDIPYDGVFKYSLELATSLKPRLLKLKEHFQVTKHIASKGSQYDFVDEETNKFLSAKSTKKGVGKVAPQVIGQCQPKKFCEIMGIEFKTIPNLKMYIQTEINKCLVIFSEYTFDCPIVFYNQEKNTIKFIRLIKSIDWDKLTYRWTCDYHKWKNSSTLKILIDNKEYALLEVQIHSKTRTNMAIRWFYENVLELFKQHFSIVFL